MKNKEFDCVAFQRKRREELSKEMISDPQGFYQKLREKFKHFHKNPSPSQLIQL